MYLRFFAVSLALLITACQSYNSTIEEPKLSVNSVEIAGVGLNGVDLVAFVDVENPNSFPLPMPRIDWELSVNEANFAQGNLQNNGSVRRRRTTTMELPINLSYDGLYRSFRSLIGEKEADFNIAMGISFPLPLLEDRVYRLDVSGHLPLVQLPILSPGNIKISKVDYTLIELIYNVTVENPNFFPIPFPKIDWDYGVNGVAVVNGSFAAAGEIAAGAEREADIVMSIVYADIFRAVDSARNAGEAQSNILLAAGLPFSAFDEHTDVLAIPGTIPLLHMPEVSFQGIARRSLGSTMEFVLNWEVDNRNSFDLDIGKFVYDFRVNNNIWAQGMMDNPPKLRAGARTVIPLDVSISSAPIVRELVDVFNRGSAVSYNSTGSMILLGGLSGHEMLELPIDLQGSVRIR